MTFHPRGRIHYVLNREVSKFILSVLANIVAEYAWDKEVLEIGDLFDLFAKDDLPEKFLPFSACLYIVRDVKYAQNANFQRYEQSQRKIYAMRAGGGMYFSSAERDEELSKLESENYEIHPPFTKTGPLECSALNSKNIPLPGEHVKFKHKILRYSTDLSHTLTQPQPKRTHKYLYGHVHSVHHLVRRNDQNRTYVFIINKKHMNYYSLSDIISVSSRCLKRRSSDISTISIFIPTTLALTLDYWNIKFNSNLLLDGPNVYQKLRQRTRIENIEK